MAEQPPLNRFYVASYAANDRDFPIVAIRLDPRVAGYRVPEDLSPHPDSKRYPNHVFTGSQPSNGDERVTHIYEILPAPWVPFTRYDDDLGPIQGRRRSVKNEGQIATLAADKRVTYEAREGSAIVYTEIEETWSIEVDEDGNSLFPVKDRDFYDPSRGAVQERRQLFVPTGEEQGTLENVNGVITQTSYEPYNEFLSVKIVQTYSVNGPKLIGQATDNDGQLVTVTTQRKGALNYIPPNPTATKTVEVSREDAESLVERIVDTPEVFTAKTFSVERPDPIPQKFRVAVPLQSNQEVVEGDAELPELLTGEISRSEEQRNKFIKRVSTTSRDQAVLPQTLVGKATDQDRQEVTITETLQVGNTSETPTATTTIESEALGDGNYVIRKTSVPEVFGGETFRKIKEDLTPQKFRGAQTSDIFEENVAGTAQLPILASGEFEKSEQQINKFVKRVSTTSREITQAVTLFESVLTPEGKTGTRKLTLTSGTQTFSPSATLIEANVEALGDGRTVKTETTIPEIFKAESFSIERPESIPQKFRALVPAKTNQFNIEGVVDDSIVLAEGEISKSEQQQTDFIKRVSSTARDQTVLPQSLVQKTTTEDLQQAIVTETLQSGDTIELPTATKTIESEAIGDGNYVVRKTEIPEVFDAKTFSKERPDPVPQKFRVLVPSLTEQETIEGDASEPSLVDGEIAKSEQQVNKFVKRTSKTSRDETQLPKSLTQKATTNEGLLASVSETLQSGDTTETPTATKTVQSEALGDGSYVVTVTNLPKVFAGETYSVERPDPLPQKFRVAARTLTTQETLEGVADPAVDLVNGQLSKSEQQITEFVKRTSVTSRDQTQLPVTLTQRSIDNDRQVVTVTETLQNTDSIGLNSATVAIESEALGDGNYVVRRTEIPEIFSAKTFQTNKDDLTPQKFRGSQEVNITEETVVGEAQTPTLGSGEFSKSEQQVNKFVKRVSTTSRDINNAVTILESVLTPQGQIGSRKLTLDSGFQSFAPSATLIDASVEALGDGRTVKTETNVPEVFTGKTIRKTKIDLTPEKFKAKQEDTITEESVAGTISENLFLSDGEFAKSEEQITEFIKRTSVTERDISATTDLTEFVVTQQGQIAERTLRLSNAPQSIQPDALLIDGSIEELGDGRTIKTEVKVSEVFAGETFTKTKEDLTPQKFRAAQEEFTKEETVEGIASESISLSENEFAKSEQQINKFIKRVSTTSRAIENATTLNERVLTQQGQIGTRVLTLSKQDQSFSPSATLIDANVEALGDGRTIKTEVTVPKVFSGKTVQKTKEDLTPAKFRSKQENTTIQETIEGVINEGITLAEGEFEKTEEQVTEFVKRVSTQTRDIETATSLEEEILTPEGIIAKRTLRLSKDFQSLQPDEKLIEGSVEELGDGRTIKTEVRVPFIFAGTTFSVERPDAIPQKFRVSAPVTTKQETIIGDAEEPNLLDGEISKSEQQTTEFLKRVSTSSRDKTQLLKTLTQKTTTNEGQLATVEEKLQEGDTLEQPNATKTIESEAVGDGTYIVRTTEVPKLFAGTTFRVTKADLTPEKFRASQEDIVIEETVEGAAEQPALSGGEFAKTEQQVTEFVKRISTTIRSTDEAQELTESVLTNDGQIGVRKLTLSNGPQDIEESELVIDASVEALGDGRTIKTEVKVPEVFDARTLSVERPDTTPAKFRSNIPVKTEQFTEKGTIEEPVLQDGDISKSEQQQTKYVKRVSISSRDQTKLPSSLEQKATNEFKQVVNIKETLQATETPEVPTATKTVESEALGDGNYIVRTSEVDDFFKAKSFSVESPDVVPAKFRSKSPTETTQEIVEGEAELPSLEEGEIAKTEQQQDEFLKRISTTTRDKTQLPVLLSQKTTTNDGILATVTETLKDSDTTEVPDAKKIVESEAIGDGLFVERITELPNIFEGKSFSVEAPDVLPAKFRAKLKTTTEQKTVEKEEAQVPSLEDGDISKTEQEVTEFLVRETKVSRDLSEEPELSQKTTNENLQLATVTEKLQKTDTIEQPTATKRIESENLGDGNYIVRTIEVDKLFEAKSFSTEKTDTIPSKFRAEVPTVTEQKNIEGEAVEPALSNDQISATNQQINERVYRETVVSRETPTFPTLTQKVTTNERQLATITEKIEEQDTSETPSATKEVQSEALGDGKYLVRTTEVDQVFPARVVRASKLDLTPEKFRAKETSNTVELTEEGDISESIDLGEGEFEKTEQQINPFVKRTTTVSRETEVVSSLEEKVLTNDGQLATRKLTLLDGEQTINPDEKLVDGSIETLGDGRTVKTEITVDTVFDAKQESKQKPDIIPAEFRASRPDITTVKVKAGTEAVVGTLEEDEVSKTVQRITEHKIRETKTVRQQGPYPSLDEELIDDDGIKISRKRTVVDGAQSVTPTATVSGQVQALGDGYTLKVEDTKAKVFRGRTFSQEKPDNIPVEFRAEKPATTEEFSEEGEAGEVTLQGDEIAKSEQQVTEFIKRTRTTTRYLVDGVTLGGGRQIDEDGVKVTVTRTLANGSQEITPSETVRGQVEDIGDGKTIKTELVRDEIFEGQIFSREKPDNIPVEFRVEKQPLVDEKTVVGDVEQPSLENSELSKSEQQITKFLKRVRTVTRDDVEDVTLEGSEVNQEGQLVTVRRSLGKSEQTITPSATLSGNVQNLGGGYTVKTEKEISKVFEGKIFSQEKPDNIPVEFRAEKPATTEEFSEEGEAAEVSLTGNEISKSEQQVTEFVKRTRTTTRDIVGDVTLNNGQQVDEDGVKVTVKRTLASGAQDISPSSTVRGQVEDIGDGKTIKTELTRGEIFEGQTFSIEKPEVIPVAFRAEKPAKVDEKTVEGDVEDVSLEGDEISKSEQQITKFLKRIRTTTRENVDTVELKGEQVNQFGQKVDVTRTLSKSDQSIDPSATISGSVEALGDDYTLKTEEELPDVFPNKTNSIERPDPAPQKFRVDLPTKTIQETVEGEIDKNLDLTGDEISKTEQQQTLFTKRTSITSRDKAENGELVGKRTGVWGEETITETYNEDGTIEVGHKILSNQKTPLGGNKFLGEKVEVASPVSLTEYKQDPDTGIFLKVEKSLIDSSTVPAIVTNGSVELQAIDAWNTIQIITTVDTLPPDEIFESTLNYRYPDELEEVGINWENGKDKGGTTDDVENTQYIVDNDISWSYSISAFASSSLRGSAYVKIKNGYSGPTKCKVTRKYYKNPPQNSPTIKDWKPVYGSLTINSVGRFLRGTRNVSGIGDTTLKRGNSRQIRTDTSANTIVFGPVVHSNIVLQDASPPSDTTVQVTSYNDSGIFLGPASSLPDGSPYPFSAVQVAPDGVAELKLPSSTTPPKSGDSNIGLVNVEKWRFGVWIEEVYEVYHP